MFWRDIRLRNKVWIKIMMRIQMTVQSRLKHSVQSVSHQLLKCAGYDVLQKSMKLVTHMQQIIYLIAASDIWLRVSVSHNHVGSCCHEWGLPQAISFFNHVISILYIYIYMVWFIITAAENTHAIIKRVCAI